MKSTLGNNLVPLPPSESAQEPRTLWRVTFYTTLTKLVLWMPNLRFTKADFSLAVDLGPMNYCFAIIHGGRDIQ
jgi:hypothetical protein